MRKECLLMKLFHNLLGLIFSFALMAVLLITSIEAVTYWTPGYYEKEYTKYQVLEAVDMEMDDLLEVTDEMMAYLRGDRKDLHVPTIVAGQPREFFNEREIAHMEDVRGLFLAAITIRRICFLVMAACAALLIVLKADTRRILPRMICGGTILFFPSWRCWQESYLQISANILFFSTKSSSPMTCGFWIRPRIC